MPGDSSGETAVNQKFGARVEGVYTADMMIFGGGSGGDLPDKAVLAPTLIDRGLQINPLIERLETMMPGGGTLLVVVPCCAADMPEALVVRCGLVDLVRRFDGVGAWLYKRPQWPEGAGSVETVLRRLHGALGHSQDDRQPDIEANIARLNRHLCFAHVIDGEMWREDDGALIRKWVDYFSGKALTAGPKCLVVGFLCLQLDENRSDACRAIEAYADALRNSSGPSVLVTKPLGLIREAHVGEWASTVSGFLEDDAIVADLLGVAKHLPEKSRHRLQEIWDKLSDAVTAAVKRRPTRFKDPKQ